MDDLTATFRFPVDLCKSEDATEERRLVDGLASAEVVDSQGEIVVQKGLDLEPIRKSGWVNWDHQKGPENLIGEPREVDLVQVAEHPRTKGHPLVQSGALRGLALYFKAELHKGLPRADAAWFHLTNTSRTRPLAWSIEGRSYERDGHRITKSELRHMAITHQPVLQVSFADVCKSLTTGVMTPLLRENLDHRMTSVLWGDSCACGNFKAHGRFSKGRLGALEHLTTCKGMTPPEASAFLKAIIVSGVAR